MITGNFAGRLCLLAILFFGSLSCGGKEAPEKSGGTKYPTPPEGVFSPSGKIYLAGDSLVQPYSEEKRPQCGWGEKLRDFLDRSTYGKLPSVYNKAHGGTSTKSYRTLGYWNSLLQLIRENDLVLIQFTANDRSSAEDRHVDIQDFGPNLTNMVNDVKRRKGVPVLLTSPVQYYFDSSGKPVRPYGEYPVKVREVAAETNTYLIDAEDLTIAWLTKLGKEAAKSCYMISQNGSDITHFTVEGATAVAEMIATAMKAQAIWPQPEEN
ncbi:MAG: hypothetical protein J5632_05710 [Bacteroidales bacterium]|nr:hypothetical protein [Bacteroidales bacterium]